MWWCCRRWRRRLRSTGRLWRGWRRGRWWRRVMRRIWWWTGRRRKRGRRRWHRICTGGKGVEGIGRADIVQEHAPASIGTVGSLSTLRNAETLSTTRLCLRVTRRRWSFLQEPYTCVIIQELTIANKTTPRSARGVEERIGGPLGAVECARLTKTVSGLRLRKAVGEWKLIGVGDALLCDTFTMRRTKTV